MRNMAAGGIDLCLVGGGTADVGVAEEGLGAALDRCRPAPGEGKLERRRHIRQLFRGHFWRSRGCLGGSAPGNERQVAC